MLTTFEERKSAVRPRDSQIPVATDTMFPDKRRSVAAGAPASMESDRQFLPDSERPKKYALGVLLVHGIGAQPSGETLVRWTDTLLDVIRRATNKAVALTVLSARTRGVGRNERAEAVVRFDTENWRDERWLIAEGWWAQSFVAPSYGELVSWSVRALPWSTALHIAQRYASVASAPGWSAARVRVIAQAVLQLLFMLALTPFFIVAMAVMLLLGLLPQLRALMLSAQSVLTATVGDSLAFVESPIRAAFIHTRILAALRRLQRDCRRTVIVAHSQGAAAVLDALGGIRVLPPTTVEDLIRPGRDAKEKARADEDADDQAGEPQTPMPDTLVTFGAGINKLASLKLLSSGALQAIGTNPAYAALVALLVVSAALAWLIFLVHSRTTTLVSLGKAALLLVAAIVLALVLVKGGEWLIDKLVASWKRVNAHREKLWGWYGGLSFAAVMVMLITAAERADLPLVPLCVLLAAVIVLAGCIVMILTPDLMTVVREMVRKPSGLTRWIDISASADPVSGGHTLTRTHEQPELQTHTIWNRGSVFSDHTAYWNNLDGFVLRVARICADAARSPWHAALPAITELADERAKWRLGFLTPLRWAAIAGWLFLLAVLWGLFGRQMPLPFDTPDWIPSAVVIALRIASLTALLMLAASLGNRLILWPWYRWERREQREALSGNQPTTETIYPIGLMVLGIGVLIAGTFAVRASTRADSPTPFSWGIEDISAPLFALSVVCAGLMAWLRPAPPWSDKPAERAAYVESRRRRIFWTSWAGFWLFAIGGTAAVAGLLYDAYVRPVERVEEYSLTPGGTRVIAFEKHYANDVYVQLWTAELQQSDAESLRTHCLRPGVLERTGRLERLLADPIRRARYGLDPQSSTQGCYLAEEDRKGQRFEAVLQGNVIQLKYTTRLADPK